MKTLMERFNRLSLTAIAQACENHGVMDGSVSPVWPAKVCGRALTVEIQPEYGEISDNIIGEIEEGTILVVNAFQFESSFLDELQQCRIKKGGAAAVVTDGTVRNTANWETIGLPVFAKGVCDRIQGGQEEAPCGIPILCGGAAVSNGDYVFANQDGIVVVPKDDIEEILEKAERIEQERADFLISLS